MNFYYSQLRTLLSGRRLRCWLLITTGLSALSVAQPAAAVRVDSIYSAEVAISAGQPMTRAYDVALERVLVKVSGLEALGSSAARKSLVPDSARLVRQYSRLADNRLRVEFDGPALRRILDAAGQPVWGVDRPLIAVWYAIDSGRGSRRILSGEAAGEMADSELLRDFIAAAATERGLPVVFPLVDAEDMAAVSFSDLWGNFTLPITAASKRYAADAILLGRARSVSTDAARVRWTLATRSEQFSWQGTVADGPRQAAQYLAQRLATFANATGALHVVVGNIDSLDKFGRLKRYFRSLNVVQSVSIARVDDDRVEYELIVRGDAARLQRSLDAGGLISPVADANTVAASGRRAQLFYRWPDDESGGQ